MPLMVRRSARAWLVIGGLQNSRNQLSGNCMTIFFANVSTELLQEAQDSKV
jgi:hypothetical protein